MNQDQLRDQAERLEALAQRLFQAHVARRGGPLPADPDWGHESVDREEWRDRARDVAPLLAERRAEEQRLLSELADTRGRLGEAQGHLWEAREHLTLLKWLHAEASFWLALDRDEHESAEALDVFHRRAVYAEQRYGWAKREIAWLRREVEFEANAIDWPWVPRGVCACLTPEGAAQVAAQPKWSLPQCSVHPVRGGDDG